MLLSFYGIISWINIDRLMNNCDIKLPVRYSICLLSICLFVLLKLPTIVTPSLYSLNLNASVTPSSCSVNLNASVTPSFYSLNLNASVTPSSCSVKLTKNVPWSSHNPFFLKKILNTYNGHIISLCFGKINH